MTPINGSLPLAQPNALSEIATPRFAPKVEQGAEGPFAAMLEHAVANANTSANVAQNAAQAFAAGTRDDIHGTMLALSKADIELRVVGNVRNKVIDAFYELWRMQV
jgi:flagellar hook-basal body complex protein FliE